MQVWYVGPICKTIIITLTGTAPTPGLHFFVTKPHFSPNRNIGPIYCTMLMLAIKHRHDDHSRLSSSVNLFFDVWHNLPFKKEGLLCCFLEWKRLQAHRSGLQRRLLGYRHDTGDVLLLIPWVWQCARNVWRRNLQVERDCLVASVWSIG